MRKLSSYIANYGPVDGPVIYTRLQREAALASAHARHMKRLRAAAARSAPNPPGR